MSRPFALAGLAALAACDNKPKFDCPDGFRTVESGCVPVDETDDPPIGQQAPDLVVEPASLDFGIVEFPCEQLRPVTISNQGAGDLQIGNIGYDSPDGAFRLDPDTLPSFPLVVPPGESVVIGVVFDPDEPTDNGFATLQITHNDPDALSGYPHAGISGFAPPVEESFVTPRPIADLMLMVDVSCSMAADNTDDVILGIPGLLDALDPVADWQLAVLSGPSGCVNIPLVTQNTPQNASAIANSIFQYYQFPFTEALFSYADLALSQSGTGDCNEGMLRPGAQLHFIIVSDEPEQSGYFAGNYQSAFDWVRHFEQYAETFVLSAVVDVNATCGYGGAGYVEAAAQTYGEILDVCQSTWGDELASIADTIEAGEPPAIALSQEAVEASIEITVDGVAATSFEYDPYIYEISRIRPIPRPGQVVDVSFSPISVCAGE